MSEPIITFCQYLGLLGVTGTYLYNSLIDKTMDIDPNLYVGVEKLPNETLENIFNNLDPSSLNVVGQVCEKWRDVVQLIHDQAWKSLTKTVMLKKDTIGPKYEGRGWIEGVHSINQCKCIDIARDLVIYNDMKQISILLYN